MVETAEGHTDRYDLVLGADGVHSTVRQLVFDAEAVRPVGHYARRFLAPGGDQAATWSVLLGAAMGLEDAIVLAESLTAAASIAEALAAYEHRRRRRTEWVLAQTHRRDRARTLPPAIRSMVLKQFGKRILHSNYRPLRDQP